MAGLDVRNMGILMKHYLGMQFRVEKVFGGQIFREKNAGLLSMHTVV